MNDEIRRERFYRNRSPVAAKHVRQISPATQCRKRCESRSSGVFLTASNHCNLHKIVVREEKTPPKTSSTLTLPACPLLTDAVSAGITLRNCRSASSRGQAMQGDSAAMVFAMCQRYFSFRFTLIFGCLRKAKRVLRGKIGFPRLIGHNRF